MFHKFQLFPTIARFKPRKSLRDNFLAMCSLPFYKKRSAATCDLIADLASCGSLNYQFKSPLLSKRPKSTDIDFKDCFKTEIFDILKDKHFKDQIDNIKEEDEKIDFIFKQDQLNVIKHSLSEFEFKKLIKKALIRFEVIAGQMEKESVKSITETKRKLLEDIAILDFALHAITCWHSSHDYYQTTSARSRLVEIFQNNIMELKKNYELILNEFYELKCDDLKPADHKQIKDYINKRNTCEILNAHLSKNAVAVKALIVERQNKYNHPRRSVWSRLSQVLHFTVFTPFLNLLIDTDSFDFVIDGFNIFSDLVHVF